MGSAIVYRGRRLHMLLSMEAIICVEAIAFAEKKFDHQPVPLDYGNVPGCTYCFPEIASVGLTEKQAKDAGYELKWASSP